MKITGILAALAAVTLAGCSRIVSVHPFVTEEQAVLEQGLAGIWADAKDDDLFIIRQEGKSYRIQHVEKNESQSFTAYLFRVGDVRILDLVSVNDDPFQLAVHTPIRVWMDGATLRYATLDSAWLREQAKARLAVETVGERLLITAPSDVILRFFSTFGAAETAFSKPVELHRQ